MSGMSNTSVTRILDIRCKLGEGPLWDVREQALYLVDVIDQRIWRYEESADEMNSWRLPDLVTSLALREQGGAIITLRTGFHFLDFDTGAVSFLEDPEASRPITQWNDGKTDAAGRFVAGTVSTDQRSACCGLYSVENGAVRRLDDGFSITNGPCWSPDGATFYWADSVPKNIYAYDYDMAAGTVANRRVFANTEALSGIPDGATVDTEGRVWSAICGGGLIACFAPSGALLRKVEMPTKFVSSVMFGGANLDRLFVTSINIASLPFETGGTADELGGELFVVDGLGARGLPETRYKG
jgi:L-arabinonolactonase